MLPGASAAVLVAAGALACVRHGARAHQVAMRNFTFEPRSIVVSPGDTVVWTNGDFVPHTATATDAAWDSKSVDGSGTWRWVATRAGRHAYYCVFHPNMRGTIEVR